MNASLDRIVQVGVIPIIRAPSVESALRISEVLIQAGIPIIEVTFTVPDALKVIRQLRGAFPELLIGAGTVVEGAAARHAIDAGAEFLVSVVAPPEVIAVGRQTSIPVIPGAFTPSEIMAALTLGVEVVKLFPASVGGPGYLRALQEPLPSLRAIPTGGVDSANVHEWFVKSGRKFNF
ncbi:MAG: bifunctional 4-hydroxy-2-oxoglutarate aldolase/2-dehydro-3-deoxy-phosphogluconate aldolase [Armatimonadetes bacterium]|nr:bifunctional 4-hydroxy-2-oxoglutarate aldolase/2-dehydro-3-deoxy-phosphogluconate aldolase [Armatimonadota bacterium]